MKKINFDTIVNRLKRFALPKVDLVVGIGEGGIVPASLIAYKLGLKAITIQINYRDEKNIPRHPEPVVINSIAVPRGVKKILLVDDVSVTGRTLELAKHLLKKYKVKTFVIKGKADYVLFPTLQGCVDWPWKKLRKENK